MQYNEPRHLGGMRGLTPAIRFLVILNVVIHLIEGWFNVPLSTWFALQPDWYRGLGFGQLFTYMFVHADFTHLLMNMVMLYFIGPTVERTLGAYRFFILYYLSGMLGGLGWSLLADPLGPGCVGASGAVFGVLGAFAAFYPNAEVVFILFPFVPMKAWKLVLLFAGWELYQTVFHAVDSHIANAAHLVGGIAGFGYAFSLKRPDLIQALLSRVLRRGKGSGFRARRNRTSDVLRPEEIDRILEKIGRHGMGALTPRERELLRKATR